MSAALRARGSWHVSAAVGVWGHGGPGTCLRPCGQGGPGTCLRLYSPVPGGTGALARVCGSGGMRRGTLADCCLALSGTGVLARVSGSAARRRGTKCQLVFSHCPPQYEKKSLDRFSVRHFSLSSVLRSSSKDSSPVLSAAPGVVAAASVVVVVVAAPAPVNEAWSPRPEPCDSWTVKLSDPAHLVSQCPEVAILSGPRRPPPRPGRSYCRRGPVLVQRVNAWI